MFAGITAMTSQLPPRSALLRRSFLKWKHIRVDAPRARVCCHTSHHLTLWTVRNVSLCLSLDTFICQSEIINTIISPNVASLFCQPFQNVTVPLHFRCMNKWKDINMSLSLHFGTPHCVSTQRAVCLPGSGSDVRFVRQQRYVTMSACKKVSFWVFPFCSAV